MIPFERVVDVRGGAFRTVLLEAGDGTPLLYLHGAAGHPGWSPFLDAVAGQYHVYAPWHPGYGRSEGIERIDDVLDMVVYYHDLLDALGIESAHIVGHDLGGMFAAELAAICGHRLRSLVLVAPLGLWLDEQPVPDFFTMSPQEYLAETWHDPASVHAQALQPDLTDNAALMLTMLERAQSLGTAGKFLWPIPDRGLRKRLHRIQSPTLLVWGEDDRIVPPAYAEAFHRAITGSQLTQIPDSGHLPMLERPAEFVRIVGGFLARGPADI